MEEKDIEIICIDCRKPFVFTVSEQRYFRDRQLFQPKRCPACRKLRKARLQGNPSRYSVDGLVGQPNRYRKENWQSGDERRDY